MFLLKIIESLINTLIIGSIIFLFIIFNSLFSRSDNTNEYLVCNLKVPQLYSEHQYHLDVVDSPDPSPNIKPQPTCKLYPPKVDCQTKACIALTFDDGPGEYTSKLLDYLRDGRAKATFFMIGVYVEKYPEVVKRVAKERHQIGNHTWVHENLTKITDQEVRESLSRTDQAIYNTSGITPKILRPPFGEVEDRITNISGKSQILWNIDAADWLHRDTKSTIDNTLANAQQGSIILLHDIYPSTVDAIPEIIKGLHAKGLEMVTIEELLGDIQLRIYYKQ